MSDERSKIVAFIREVSTTPMQGEDDPEPITQSPKVIADAVRDLLSTLADDIEAGAHE